MDAILSFRHWIARYGRTCMYIGFGLMLTGAWMRFYAQAGLGLVIMALAAWGMLMDPHGHSTPYRFTHRRLNFLMWSGIFGCAFVALVLLVNPHLRG